jgi:hypothetical protein
MKRSPIVATAVLAGAIPLLRESESVRCDENTDITCAAEQIARVPEPQHAAEEPPDYESPEGFVMVAFSPPIFVERGSKEHIEL